jgi:hypothetical protein
VGQTMGESLLAENGPEIGPSLGESMGQHQGANSCTCAQDFCACAHCPKTQGSFT